MALKASRDYWRWQYDRRHETLPNVFDRTVDLPEDTCISSLWIELRGLNGTTSNLDNPVYKLLDRIQVLVNGDQPAFYCDSECTQALDFYTRKLVPPDYISEWADDRQTGHFRIYFGRWPGDQEYYLDTSEFDSAQLKITGNIANVRAAAADTAFVSGSLDWTLKWQVHASKPPTHKGWLRATERKTYNPTQGGDELTVLPKEWPYREILFRPYKETHCPKTEIEHAQLECNDAAILPFSQWTEDLRDENKQMMMCEANMCINIFKKAGDVTYPPVAEITDANGVAVGDNPIALSFATKSCDTLDLGSNCAVYTGTWAALSSAAKIQLWLKGLCYHYTFVIPFPQSMDWATEKWFPANEFTNVKLRLRGYATAAPSGTTTIVLQDVISPGSFTRI